jgi:hypothetical protein
LASDWNAEVRASFLRRIVAVVEAPPLAGLFEGQRLRDMDVIVEAARTPFERILAEVACDAVNQGQFGPDGARGVVETALEERGLRRARQVEEHWHRERPNRTAMHVRNRVDQAIAAFDKGSLARHICEGLRPNTPGPVVRNGLDDGVNF